MGLAVYNRYKVSSADIDCIGFLFLGSDFQISLQQPKLLIIAN